MFDIISYLLGKTNQDAPYQPVYAGLEYETGEWKPSEDVAHGEISFVNSHDNAPFFAAVVLDEDEYSSTQKDCFLFAYLRLEDFTNGLIVNSDASSVGYAFVYATSRATNAESLANNTKMLLYPYAATPEELTLDYQKFYVTNEKLKPYNNYSDRTWKSSKNYKWIAVWM